VVKLVAKAFADHLDAECMPAAPRRGSRRPRSSAQVRVVPRVTEQAHLVLGVPGLVRNDPRRFTAAVLSTALGGGMSSRLFQEVREKRGLAYSVYSYAQGFSDTGVFGLYVGCLPAKVDTVLDVCLSELESVAHSGLSSQELARGRGQVKGATVLGQEDTGARMTRIAKSELHGEPLLGLTDLLARVDSVSDQEVHDLARELFTAPKTLAVIGPFDSTHAFNAVAS
jgi:predicted Zn-dependent peptidase